MMKYSNYIVLVILVLIGLLLKDSLSISTNLLSLFASKDNLEKLNIANNLGYSKEMLIAVKGFDLDAKKKVKSIVSKLKELKEIESIQYKATPSKEIQQYFKNNYLILSDFNATKLKDKDILNRLKELYNAQLNSFFYTAINKTDPLNLFTLKNIGSSNSNVKNGFISLGEYGYLIRVRTKVAPSDMKEAKILYDKTKSLLKQYDGVIAFAPFFYTVENSAHIKSDVQIIVVLSTIVLLIIYFFILKNIRLLTHIVVALASSMLFATLICLTLFENFNVLSLAFGMSLSAVSIDYLLHYYFHNFYANSKKIDRNVLYGFLTTVIAFTIFSFIPVPLISQISVFSVLSLSFAYILFTFIFPYLDIKNSNSTIKKESIKPFLSANTIFAVSIVLIIYSSFNLKLDLNIRNLDYQNISLQNLQKIFKNSTTSSLKPVIVEANSEDELISNLEQLDKTVDKTFSLATFIKSKHSYKERLKVLSSYDFKRLNRVVNRYADEVGFKKGYFKDAYKFNIPKEIKSVDFNIFKSLLLSVYKHKGKLYSIALVSKDADLSRFDFVTDIDVKEMFNRSSKDIYKNLILFGSFVLVVILILLFISVKSKIIYALNYILFPLALSVASVVTFSELNIMHLFSLIILVAIGIDYGIYMSNSKQTTDTALAIRYSLLSTFAAFGVLIFSSIVALNSIGVIITLGCIAIYILIKVMR